MITQILYFILAFFILWVFFVNVITWRDNKDKIPKWLLVILYPIAFIGWLWDMAFNIIYGTIMFMQIPNYRRLTLTARLTHILIVEVPSSWRYRIAYFLCTKLIEPWDYNHCGLASKK